MSEREQNTGALSELNSNSPDSGRSVEYRFANGVSGDLTLLSGSPLDEGEVYLLTGAEPNRRIEIMKASQPQDPGSDAPASYRFRAV